MDMIPRSHYLSGIPEISIHQPFLVFPGYHLIHVFVYMDTNIHVPLCHLKEGGIVDMPVVVVAELKDILSTAYHLDHFLSVIIC